MNYMIEFGINRRRGQAEVILYIVWDVEY